ncbi:MAG TPA: spore coat U domain-containing protein [Sphingopyxis sp.]|nr:spore coat U domain-containing protein [Sphingopyxis sp.]HMP43862.1 spore coat U domain-containing protein [Sphingopyxis sp.]HMQ20066.1 spore coat U domain-containing protein [Sphingopyxis sp.]
MTVRLAAFAAFACFPGAAQACTVATTSTSLGSTSSYAAAQTVQQGSGSAGLSCDILLAALTTHYVGLSVDASTFELSGPAGSSIAFEASLTPGGAALGIGNFQNLSSLSLVSLFSGTDNMVPIYFRTTPTAALRAGTYTGHLDLRWFYSVCSIGVVLCVNYSASPGFVRPLPPLVPLNWGSGTPVRVNVELTIENDCIIDAPALDFGSAPLAGGFSPVTQTIQIRCSAGAAYTVGLDNGDHASGNVRRMANGGDHLAYEIYKGASSLDRWGLLGAERRSSTAADSNAGVYDSFTAQGFTYRAVVGPAQPTPSVGNYSDTVRIDVEF